ncbi:transposase [Streptomyces sp. Marseille-Q5077]|uniref:transposase n=1 Tax=Streptomyces sp. Marseille-Q5077 TaxID=3418995 RepID=UPI003CFCA8FA
MHLNNAYSSRGFRAYLRRRGIAQNIPDEGRPPGHRRNRGRRGGRPPAFDRQTYRQRNIVERCFNGLKGCRGVATRYEETATSIARPACGAAAARETGRCRASPTKPSPVSASTTR